MIKVSYDHGYVMNNLVCFWKSASEVVSVDLVSVNPDFHRSPQSPSLPAAHVPTEEDLVGMFGYEIYCD